MELIYEIEGDVTLENALNVLLDHKDMEEAMKTLSESHQTQRRIELRDHFIKRYLNQPPEQMGGVRETIGNYLQCFSTPDIAEVFCVVGKSNTFEFSDIDHGKIICVSMPQKYQMERRYVNTFLKMLFYTHVLRRFDKTKDERADDNLLILWADEAQRFVTAAEDGMSDFNSVDVIREARATLVAAAQSSTSFIPPLGNDKAKVLTLNLRNRIIFKAADEMGAVDSADFLGQKKVTKRSWGYSNGMMTRNYVSGKGGSPIAGRGGVITWRIGRMAKKKSGGQFDFNLAAFLPVERRQLADLLVGRAGQALQHVFEVGIRFHAVPRAVLDQSVKDGAALARFFGAEEEPVLFFMRSCA